MNTLNNIYTTLFIPRLCLHKKQYYPHSNGQVTDIAYWSVCVYLGICLGEIRQI